MNHIIKEIDYCVRHAQYSPIKIYAGDEIDYSLNCSMCLSELTKAAHAPNLSHPKKVVKPLKQVIEVEQELISPFK